MAKISRKIGITGRLKPLSKWPMWKIAHRPGHGRWAPWINEWRMLWQTRKSLAEIRGSTPINRPETDGRGEMRNYLISRQIDRPGARCCKNRKKSWGVLQIRFCESMGNQMKVLMTYSTLRDCNRGTANGRVAGHFRFIYLRSIAVE
jgi:hypothetical protein